VDPRLIVLLRSALLGSDGTFIFLSYIYLCLIGLLTHDEFIFNFSGISKSERASVVTLEACKSPNRQSDTRSFWETRNSGKGVIKKVLGGRARCAGYVLPGFMRFDD